METYPSLCVVVQYLDKEVNFDNMLVLMHLSIIYGKEAGAPRKQTINKQPVPTQSVSNVSTTPVTSVSGGFTNSSGKDGTASGSFETRLMVWKKEYALKQVELHASNPEFTSTHVMLGAIKCLGDAATRQRHKEAEYYAKSLQT
ncbi:hypothetical protein KUTeg_012266 [Tegillarca granosa]|uniref:Uncharacterized protein n=1 Tax=Tegillarca granosa TaxID=220873 RepID=A0ABQ9EZ22_TEGGR|nr:hypothetical protein KUTeg_012266 [Tegillarca granosa]